jgi:hypothetical protein
MILMFGLLAILAMTVVAMFLTRHKTLKAPVTMLVYGMVVAACVIGFDAYDRIQEQRAYDLCVDAVTRSDGSRAYQKFFIGILDRELPGSTITDELRTALDTFLPDRSLDECPQP